MSRTKHPTGRPPGRPPIHGESMVRITLDVTREIRDKLKADAKKLGVTVASLARKRLAAN